MLKNKNGVTLFALVATIMVILILTTTAVVSYSTFNVSARVKSFANEIYILQKQIEDYNFRNNKYPIKEDAREIEISSIDEDLASIFQSNGEIITNGKVNLYEIEYKKLDLEALNRGMNTSNSSKDIYLFSKTTKNVYYIAGEKIGDEVYYYLTDDLYKSLKIK